MTGPKPKKQSGRQTPDPVDPKARFQEARAHQAEADAKIAAAKIVGSKFGSKARAAEKAKADSVAFDAGQAYRKSRPKRPK